MTKKEEKQINMPMAKKTHDRIRKAWEAEETDKKLSSWVLETLLLFTEKEKWLKNYAPHLIFVGIDKNGILLRDKHLKDSIVEVKLLDNRLWCQVCDEKNCMHVFYSIGLPHIAKIVNPEKLISKTLVSDNFSKKTHSTSISYNPNQMNANHPYHFELDGEPIILLKPTEDNNEILVYQEIMDDEND